MFPGDASQDLATRLSAWLLEAYARADVAALATDAAKDAAARAFAYWRAFDSVWLRMSSSPASVSLTDGGAGSVSTSYTASQMDAFRRLADGEWSAFVGTVAPPAAPSTASAYLGGGSGAVPTRYTF